MIVNSLRPDLNQEHQNEFKKIYPWKNEGRCVVDKDTYDIIELLHNEDSRLNIDGELSCFDKEIHDICVIKFPRHTKTTIEGAVVSDSILLHETKRKVFKGFTVERCFLDSENNILDYILIGAFPASIIDGQLRSVPGETPASNLTREEFNSYLKNGRNDNFSIMDYETHMMLLREYKIQLQNTNSQFVVGSGNVNGNLSKTGETMTIGTQTGYGFRWNNEKGDAPNGKIVGMAGLNTETGRFDWWAKDGTSPSGIEAVVNTGDNGVFYDENALEVL